MINTKVLTSLTNPLYVNYISQEILKKSGKLGMTFAPGKKDNSATLKLDWDRDVEQDVLKLKEYSTNILISVIEDFEYELLKIEKLKDTLKKNDIKNIQFQIVDGSIPKLNLDEKYNILDYYNLVKELNSELEKGMHIVIHCRGGLGRTGTLAAAILIYNGFMPDEAIKIVRNSRKDTIENSSNALPTLKKTSGLSTEEYLQHKMGYLNQLKEIDKSLLAYETFFQKYLYENSAHQQNNEKFSQMRFLQVRTNSSTNETKQYSNTQKRDDSFPVPQGIGPLGEKCKSANCYEELEQFYKNFEEKFAGADGNDGPTGIKGPKGEKGVTGAKGPKGKDAEVPSNEYFLAMATSLIQEELNKVVFLK